MTNSRSLVLSVALSLLPVAFANAQVRQGYGSLPNSPQSFLSLSDANDGQHLSAAVGQQIEITLGRVGPPRYGEPQVSVSSPAVRLEGTALRWPVNPGGPTFVYMFDAAAEGEAEIRVFGFHASGFAVTIRVEPASGNLRKRGASPLLDQENSAPWNNKSVSLDYVNGPGISPKSAIRDLSQTFVPRLPNLTAIEVELAAAKPGQSTGDVELTLMSEHQVLAQVWKAVPVSDCDHVLFPLPNGGVTVVPGHAYSIRLTGIGGVLGWKYVVGGYAKGAASSERKPLLQDGRSTFLFRTFGTKRHAQ